MVAGLLGLSLLAHSYFFPTPAHIRHLQEAFHDNRRLRSSLPL